MRRSTSPRVVRPAGERRADIVAAAFECLQESGYAKFTARKVAARMDISLGHLTYHFRDMREILVETYRYASLLLLRATREDLDRSPKSPLDQLRAYLEAGFGEAFLSHGYLRVRIDLWSAACMSSEIAAVERELYDQYRQKLMVLVDAAVAEVSLPPERVVMLVDTMMAILDGLWLDFERRGDKDAVKNGLAGCTFLVEAAMRLQTTAG